MLAWCLCGIACARRVITSPLDDCAQNEMNWCFIFRWITMTSNVRGTKRCRRQNILHAVRSFGMFSLSPGDTTPLIDETLRVKMLEANHKRDWNAQKHFQLNWKHCLFIACEKYCQINFFCLPTIVRWDYLFTNGCQAVALNWACLQMVFAEENTKNRCRHCTRTQMMDCCIVEQKHEKIII